MHRFDANKQPGELKKNSTWPADMQSFDEELLRKNGDEELPNKLNSTSSSLFSDIKQVLKAVEYSKLKIEAENVTELRDRNNKMFYVLTSTGPNK
jgi:hypothetical protein